jgi:hypothetical protein
MNNKNIFLPALSLLLFGILSLLSYIHVINLNTSEILGVVFLAFGLITVYKTFGNEQRGILSLGVVVFLFGIVLIMKSRFALLDMRSIAFTSILFIGGATFFILFLDNKKQKAFLYSGMSLVILSIVTVVYLKDLKIFYYAKFIDSYFEYFWPVILIIMGISLFHSRKN